MVPNGDKSEDWRPAADGPPPWYFFVLAILTLIIASACGCYGSGSDDHQDEGNNSYSFRVTPPSLKTMPSASTASTSPEPAAPGGLRFRGSVAPTTDVRSPSRSRRKIAIAIQNVLRWFRGR
jgi:hypothetical protein